MFNKPFATNVDQRNWIRDIYKQKFNSMEWNKEIEPDTHFVPAVHMTSAATAKLICQTGK